MRYLLSGDIRTDVNTIIADRYRKYLVNGANLSYIFFPEGDILSQEILIGQYRIIIKHYFISTEYSISVLTEQPNVMLHFMMEGNILVKTGADSVSLQAGAWQMLYAPGNKVYSLYLDKGHSCSIHIEFECQNLEELSQGFPQLSQMAASLKCDSDSGLQCPPAVIDFRVKTLMNEIIDVDRGDPGERLYVRAKVCELLWHYNLQLNRSADTELNGAYVSKLSCLKNYIIGNLDLPLGTSFLARKFQLSVTSLKRQFKLYSGKSIRAFVVEQRMERAMEIILHSQQSISDIGSQLGYAEFSSFTRAFTRYFGHSPNYFRKTKF